ncbi:MAG: bifunctional diaminohydroxyphosphoribosylaminopyrimidine deaminase/5-amino-6-(5-phosphoribosylamino)uracil reductase RibD [Acidobacteriota bacterium]|nr:bifunctional diaminohydroxyphosphoribosylaminopyrimidine deaminase/5-amino-6-(5-phosphoribosylamino)uracil reductase RibD [Blastocatellia bacterium]MDW8411774.1 bifunctional diaminohydroxyphosphoribosylaminopyrimidine deaminase/5-amino-6-(5-phosphoribosylamino)uracil reductase RibD [Acidobacteriota bacterium]
MNDELFMRRALELAAKGRGQVSPNPMVGAVIVKNGEVVGEGYHTYAGLHHAEIIALQQAAASAKEATCYVTLEPCCHYGRTPPCSKALINAGISRVVVAMSDPNPMVAGRGIEELRTAGIQTHVGVLRKEAEKLNEIFIKYITSKRPFIHLKSAITLDGKIATRRGHSRWITSEASRYRSQLLRAEYDAIAVGSGTVLADDPELTLRIAADRHRPLHRVILDRRLRTPVNARLFRNSAPVSIFACELHAASYHGKTRLKETVEALTERGAKVIFCPQEDYLRSVLDRLSEMQITSLIVEGGSEINWQFITHSYVDKLTLFVAPLTVGGTSAPSFIGGQGFDTLSQALRFKIESVSQLDTDICIVAYPTT